MPERARAAREPRHAAKAGAGVAQELAQSGDAGAESEVLARLRAPTGARLQAASIVVFVLIALDMIFKPWA